MTAAEASPLSAIKYRKKKFKKSMKVKTVLLRSAGEITHKKKKKQVKLSPKRRKKRKTKEVLQGKRRCQTYVKRQNNRKSGLLE